MYKIVVLCGGKFAFPALQILGLENYLAGIAIGNGDHETVELLQQESRKSEIPFITIDSKIEVNNLYRWIQDIKPDAIFSICFPYLIPKSILQFTFNKCINFHTGPLPEYRGSSPIFEVLRSQEKQTAVSVHLMNDRFDEGAIILREIVTIDDDETYGSLTHKLSMRTGMTALNVAQMLQFSTFIPTVEQDETQALYYPKPTTRDTRINWSQMHAKQIETLINACNPWNLGAETTFNGQLVKIIEANSVDFVNQKQAGSIIGLNNVGHLQIACIEDQCLNVKILSTNVGIISAEKFYKLENCMSKYFI